MTPYSGVFCLFLLNINFLIPFNIYTLPMCYWRSKPIVLLLIIWHFISECKFTSCFYNKICIIYYLSHDSEIRLWQRLLLELETKQLSDSHCLDSSLPEFKLSRRNCNGLWIPLRELFLYNSSISRLYPPFPSPSLDSCTIKARPSALKKKL